MSFVDNSGSTAYGLFASEIPCQSGILQIFRISMSRLGIPSRFVRNPFQLRSVFASKMLWEVLCRYVFTFWIEVR